MAFQDPTTTVTDTRARSNKAKLRRKINSVVPRKEHIKNLAKLAVDDTVEVHLDGILRKGRIQRINPTTAILHVPETGEVWRVSGYYLYKVKSGQEIY